MEMFGDNCCPPPCNTLGFLQKNNSLDDKGRLAGQKNLLSCDNSDRDARFRLTETDFSNLYARGERHMKTRLPENSPQSSSELLHWSCCGHISLSLVSRDKIDCRASVGVKL